VFEIPVTGHKTQQKNCADYENIAFFLFREPETGLQGAGFVFRHTGDIYQILTNNKNLFNYLIRRVPHSVAVQ
jgi:hypothetical protein